MTQQPFDAAEFEDALLVSGSVLQAHTALARVISDHAVENSHLDASTLDLLVRLQIAQDNLLRGVDLCQQLNLSKSYVSRLLDRAEHDGLVARSPDPCDRRAQQITLTSQGGEAVRAFAPDLVSVLNQSVNNILTKDEADTLVKLLGRITESSERLFE